MTGIDAGPLLRAAGSEGTPEQVRSLELLLEEELEERVELCLIGLATERELTAYHSPASSLSQQARALAALAPRLDDLIPQVILGLGADLIVRLGGWLKTERRPDAAGVTVAVEWPASPRTLTDVLERGRRRPWAARKFSDLGPVEESLAFRGFRAPGSQLRNIIETASALRRQAQELRDAEELATLSPELRTERDAVALLVSQGLAPPERLTRWHELHCADRSPRLRILLRQEIDALLAQTTGVTAEHPHSWLYPASDPVQFDPSPGSGATAT